MNVLLRAMVGIRRLATPGAGFAFCVAGMLLGIEVLGRQSPSDLHDLLAMLAIAMVAITVMTRHRKTPVPGMDALSRIGDRLIAGAKKYTVQMGLDFRGDPPVKRGVPPFVLWSAIILAVSAVVLLATARWVPSHLRTALVTVSYLVYLFLLSVLWFGLVIAMMLAAFIPMAVIHDTLIARHRGPRRRSRRPEIALLCAYFGILFGFGLIAPTWLAPLVSATLTVIYLIGIIPARRFAVQFLWRPRDSVRVRSLAWGQWVTWEFILIGLLIQVLTLASCGSLLFGDDLLSTVMPLTALMGMTLAWLGPGLMAMLCLQMVLGRLRDPSRPAKPTVHIRDHTDGTSVRGIRRLFADRGWHMRLHPRPPEALDVCIELVEFAPPRQEPEREWPLVTTLANLQRDGMFVRLHRRDEIQRRRRFFTGMKSLLKIAGTRNRGGCGYWLSPHYWFVAGLMRDTRPGEEGGEFDLTEDPILTGSVGPPYHRVFPRAVRHHLYQMFRATAVDLIFIEDGVSFKRLRKVLRVLFEVYDVHSGRRPAEEIDFRGLPGTRVMIHDFQFDEPFASETYPEPKYEFLGRARILHIFKDRGGSEELIEPPFDIGRRPAPVSMF